MKAYKDIQAKPKFDDTDHFCFICKCGSVMDVEVDNCAGKKTLYLHLRCLTCDAQYTRKTYYGKYKKDYNYTVVADMKRYCTLPIDY